MQQGAISTGSGTQGTATRAPSALALSPVRASICALKPREKPPRPGHVVVVDMVRAVRTAIPMYPKVLVSVSVMLEAGGKGGAEEGAARRSASAVSEGGETGMTPGCESVCHLSQSVASRSHATCRRHPGSKLTHVPVPPELTHDAWLPELPPVAIEKTA